MRQNGGKAAVATLMAWALVLAPEAAIRPARAQLHHDQPQHRQLQVVQAKPRAVPGEAATGKPGPTAPAPAPQASAELDKFGQPVAPAPPPPGPAAGTEPAAGGKFGPPAAASAPPPAAPGTPEKFGQAPASPPVANALPPTAPQTAPPAIAIPADEPASLTRLRGLLGPDVAIRYRAAEPDGEGIRLSGAVFSHALGSLAAETLRLADITADRIGTATARDLTITGSDGSVATIAALDLAGLAARPDAPERMALDRLRLETVVVKGDTQLALAEFALENFGAGRPGKVALAGLHVLVPQAGVLDRVRIGRVALSGLDLGATVAALGAGELPPRGAGAYAFELAEASASLAGTSLGTLASLGVTGDLAGGVETSRLELRELRLAAQAPLDEWLTRYGYQALVADLASETRFDRAAGTLDVPAMALGLRDAGAIGLTYQLSGVTTESAAAMDFDAWRLSGFTLRVADQSFYGRLVRDEARRSKQPEAAVRERFAAQAAAALGGARAGGPLLPALQRFLRGEATVVEVIARPPQPLGIEGLTAAAAGGPLAVQRALGLTAEAR